MAIFRCALLETGVVEFPINISVFERRIILNEIPRRLSLFISCIGVSTCIKQKLYLLRCTLAIPCCRMERRLSRFIPCIGVSTSIKQKLYPFSSSNNMEGRLSIFYPYIGISTLR